MGKLERNDDIPYGEFVKQAEAAEPAAPVRTVAQLRKAAERAERRADDYSRALRHRRSKLIDEATARIDKTLVAENAKRVELNIATSKVKGALHAAIVAEAMRDPRFGTFVAEWKLERSFQFRKDSTRWMKTGRRGILDVWSDSSPHAANITWSVPHVGDVYVRLLKKDGTRSLAFETLSLYKGEWLPEGEAPNEKAAKSKRTLY